MVKPDKTSTGLSLVLPVYNEVTAVLPEIRRIQQVLIEF